MAEFPKIIQADGFTLEKVKPTFDTAKYLFELVDRQREFLVKWLEWVDFSNCPEDMYPHLLKSSETKSSNFYIVQDNKIIGSISFVVFSEIGGEVLPLRCPDGDCKWPAGGDAAGLNSRMKILWRYGYRSSVKNGEGTDSGQ